MFEPNLSTSNYEHLQNGRGSFAFSKEVSLSGKPNCSFCDRGVVGGLIPSPLNDDAQRPPCFICAECVVTCNVIIESSTPYNDSLPVGVAQQPTRKLAQR
jgi:hypothetical protein